MGYNRQVYTQILREYEIIRDNQEKELELRKEEIYRKIPRIQEIDQELHTTGLTLTRRILQQKANEDNIVDEIKQKSIDLNMEKGELLATNNYSVDYLTIKFQCIKCKDTGYVDNSICQCFKQKLIERAYSQSNLSSILDTQNFDNFDFTYYSTNKKSKEHFSPRENMESIFETCFNFVKSFDKSEENLLLYGEPGLGKTFLSSCIAKDLLDQGKTVFYQTANNIFGLLEDYKFRRSEQIVTKDQIDRLFDVDLLIIDDLGTEFVNAYTSSTFFNILNTRLLNKQKTIINTNLDISELDNLYSNRVISRLIGHYITLKFFGEDIRKIKLTR